MVEVATINSVHILWVGVFSHDLLHRETHTELSHDYPGAGFRADYMHI